MKVGELFAGIGGIGLGFKLADFQIVWANEQDEKAAITYQANFPETDLRVSRMEEVDDTTIASLSPIDVLTGGFPCQAFSIAGKREGFNDVRGKVFFDILRYLCILQPKAIFLENVKNLTSHDGGNIFCIIKDKLEELGYHLTYRVLNTADYTDVPQNRERIYIIGFKNKACMEAFQWPTTTHKVRGIRELLEQDVNDEAYFYDKSKYHAQLKAEMTNEHTLYQWRRVYARENKSNLCPTLTANMGTGGHNVPLVLDGGRIRKLMPRECARFQGFPDGYKLPDTLGKATLYKQIGNSVSVPVVELLAKAMMRALRSGDRNDVFSEPE
jgi:DNA (cytosine-5)-methyltransferase 1